MKKQNNSFKPNYILKIEFSEEDLSGLSEDFTELIEVFEVIRSVVNCALL